MCERKMAQPSEESRRFDMNTFRRVIGKYFEIIDDRLDRSTFRPIFVIRASHYDENVLKIFDALHDEIQKMNFVPKLLPELKNIEPFQNLPPEIMYIVLEPQIYDVSVEAPKWRKRIWINWVLFLATIGTVITSGYLYIFLFDPIHGGVGKPVGETILYIFAFTISILGIVGLHELGAI